MTQSIAIIGGGIVGSTAAYYLSRFGHQVTVYDEGTGQATSAAAGIICPWLSKRRNKPWYRLAAGGAAFYHQMLADLNSDGQDTSFYKRSGAVLLKKKAKATQDQYDLGVSRRQDAPEIGDLTILSEEELEQLLPGLKEQEHALYVAGGARVDGQQLVATLLSYVVENGGKRLNERAHLLADNIVESASGQHSFDHIILATGAWLPHILQPLGFEVDIRGQKGQLAVLQTANLDNGNLPVIMPEGEIDILPLGNGRVFVGASHENDLGYDLTKDDTIIQSMIQNGQALFDDLKDAELIEVKVGTRAYTSDFSPFFGYLPTSDTVLTASGLGSSGLTTGPLIGYQLALLASGQEASLPLDDYSPAPYIKLMG